MQLAFLSRVVPWLGGKRAELKLIALSDELDAELARLMTGRTCDVATTDDNIRHLLTRCKELNAEHTRRRVRRDAKATAH